MAAPQGHRGRLSGVDEIDEADLPDDLLEWIHDGEPEGSGKRSTTFFIVVKALRRLGYSAEAIFELLDRYPNGIAQKYLDQGNSGSRARLQREVERAYDRPPKAPPPVPPAVAATASGSAAGSAPVSPAPQSSSSPLADAHAIFKKWLGCDI